MKKLIAFLLTVLMLSTMCTAFAEDIILIAPNPNAAPKTVSLQVEGIEGNVYYGEVAWTEGATALSVLETALKDAKVEYVVKDSQYGGKFVDSIGQDTSAKYGGYDGWMFYVDGQSPMFSIDAYALQGGEQVLVAYGDMNLVLPVITAHKNYKGQVTVQVEADVTYYDESWNASIVREPMTGTKVTVDGVEYTADDKGQVVLSAESAAKETVSLQVEKIAEGGAPLLARLAPDYTLDLTAAETVLPFSDVAEGKWYTESVLQMSELGAVTGFPDGTFQPDGIVTRAQVANVLFKLSGGIPVNYLMTFSDVNQEAWYAEGIRWAAAEGVVTGADGKFNPNAPVTRQDLAVMLVRYQTKVLEKELPQTGEAPAFADNDQIAAYAAESVYLMQKAGIINGIDGSFQPKGTATRAQLCKMLAGLVVSD